MFFSRKLLKKNEIDYIAIKRKKQLLREYHRSFVAYNDIIIHFIKISILIKLQLYIDRRFSYLYRIAPTSYSE